MKFIYIITILAALVFNQLFAKIKYLTDQEIRELSKSSKILSNTYTRIIEGIDEGDTYFLDLQYKGKSINCYVDKKTGTIYKGSRYDKSGVKSVFIKSPKRVENLKKALTNGISFSYGEGEDLYIFTDPECPYCRKFDKLSQGLLSRYKIHIILYPLRFHKKAPAMTAWVLDAKTDKERYERLEKLMIHDSKEYLEYKGKIYTPESNKILNRGRQAVRLMQVRGTPTIFDKNFNKINWGTLLKNERKLSAKKDTKNSNK